LKAEKRFGLLIQPQQNYEVVSSSSLNTMMTINNVTVLLVVLLSAAYLTPSTNALRLYFNDSSTHQLDSTTTYDAHNIFVSSGSTLELINGAFITAPSSVDDGESAIRVDDAKFIGVNGTIIGGASVGGVGVTISTSRDSEFGGADASFGSGMTVYGGDAARKETTQGGDAVQVLQSGSKATFEGGVYVAGKGCSPEVCGVTSYNGNAINVIMGEVIVKGGTFDGDFYNLKGSIQILGCVEYKNGRINGVLSDGSVIDVAYVGEKQPDIVYSASVCPATPATADPTSRVGPGRSFSLSLVLASMTVSLAVVVCL
jgi:hypothetical protein